MELNIQQIMEILPHRPPFLLVDRITECEPGVKAAGIKCVTMNEPFFVGHFPGNPIMPGVLILEALAQTGAVAALSLPENRGKLAIFGGVKNARFKQPVRPGDVLELWDRILKDYDELVYIPMSSGLSSSCETAVMLAQDYGGRVQVVNNQRISVTLRQSALDAQALAAAGRSAAEIKALLEQTKFDSDIYITVDTLKYLKKGGRCTPAAAAIGTVLNLKPVLRIKGEKLDSFAKARGWKAAKKTMLDTARRVMETDFAGCRGPEDLHIAAAFTGTREEAQEWLEELEAAFPGYPIHMDPLSLSVACHIGPGARAVTLTKVLPI